LIPVTEFVVEEIFPMSSRHVPFLWGTLSGGDLRIGDEVFMDTSEGRRGGSVTTIELHKPLHVHADHFSIAVSGDLVPFVSRGSVLRKAG
jgi:hypothetical protein